MVGYARCSTDSQDLTARIDGLTRLGMDAQRVYLARLGRTQTEVCIKLGTPQLSSAAR